jgi:hypothetical protein
LSIKRGNFHIIDQNEILIMQTGEIESKSGKDFWDNANKYSWSNGEYEFLKEMSFIMVNLHHQNNSKEE